MKDEVRECCIDDISPHPDNRPLQEKYVNSLVEEMKINSELASSLIICNSEKQVLNGIHRLEAHKRLGHKTVMVIFTE